MEKTLIENVHFFSNLCWGQTTWPRPMKFLHKKSEFKSSMNPFSELFHYFQKQNDIVFLYIIWCETPCISDSKDLAGVTKNNGLAINTGRWMSSSSKLPIMEVGMGKRSCLFKPLDVSCVIPKMRNPKLISYFSSMHAIL